ncbi:MAG TPA: dTDP-4-dehydrorhamnose 3,5-epimerase [Planctomycetaceae bacterium]|jgi:dTDP-4-dehydrorhamnose 3,5-epimerase|nr:dTDP-4-dehydrorhamnose 3,5-epimerase [Planctomycetaceae bacterium]
MQFHKTDIPGVILIEPKVFGDERGFFMETYHQPRFAAAGIDLPFVQDNHSRSRKGVLRGLHYQLRHAQGKLVRVVQGEIFDVAVDARRSSPTFGRWFGAVLSDSNRRQLYVPPGFAHGFCVVSDSADVLYKTTDVYHPEEERSVLWNDPAIGITWPVKDPIISAKDQEGKLLAEAECFP